MNTLNAADLKQVSGGLIGGGYTRNGIPLLDASATREPGQNSSGEWTPGGAEHYAAVAGWGQGWIEWEIALAQQALYCYSGDNPIGCAIATVNAFRAAEAVVDHPAPYVRGPQGK